MHAVMNAAQSQALARLVHELHPTWDIPGIAAAISRAKGRGSIEALCIAAVRIAMRDDLRSPAVLAEDGPHWRTPGEPSRDDHRFTRCTEPGHGSFPAWNCSACRAEEIADIHGRAEQPDPNTPDPAVTTAGAALVRTAMRQAGITPTPRSA